MDTFKERYGADQAALRAALQSLPTDRHRLVFAASCCERVVPAYEIYAMDEGLSEPGALSPILDRLWDTLTSGDFPPAGRVQADLEIVRAIQSGDDAESHFVSFIEDVHGTLGCTLEYLLQRDFALLVSVVRSAENHVTEWSSQANWALFGGMEDSAEFIERQLTAMVGLPEPVRPGILTGALDSDAIIQKYNQPLCVNERIKRMLDISVLQAAPALTSGLLRLMRRSSQLQGVQLLLRLPCLRKLAGK